MFIVIPAYRPDDSIFNVIGRIRNETDRFVIVDDGSGFEYASVFRRLEKEYPKNLTVIHHSINRGKGHALKSAFEYISGLCGEDDGVLTIDCDRIDLAENAERVAEAWRSDPDSFVIGSCRYSGKVPVNSKYSNSITRSVFAITTGVRVYDTQSGLRAFSVRLIPEFLKIKGERYDFDIAQLLYAVKQHIDIKEVPIETVFTPGNRSSHFHVFRDSWLIYRMIFVFMLSSFSCFLIDYSLLLTLAGVFKRLPSAVLAAPAEYRLPVFGMQVDTHLLALVIARSVSSFCNFLLNRKVVFKTSSRTVLLRYYAVVIGILLANHGLLSLITTSEGLPLWIGQLVVQAVLYPINFLLQRKFVFPVKGGAKKGTDA